MDTLPALQVTLQAATPCRRHGGAQHTPLIQTTSGLAWWVRRGGTSLLLELGEDLASPPPFRNLWAADLGYFTIHPHKQVWGGQGDADLSRASFTQAAVPCLPAALS